jgi:hypothetical protein
MDNLLEFINVTEKYFKLWVNPTVPHQAAYFLKHSSFYRSSFTDVDTYFLILTILFDLDVQLFQILF